MWKTDEPVKVSRGCTVESHYGSYSVVDPSGEQIGTIDPSYFNKRRDVLYEARMIVTQWYKQGKST